MINQHYAEKYQLIQVSGRLDHEQTPQLEAALTEALNTGYNLLLVDLTDTDYINSGGLRCLVSVWRQARQQDGNLLLCGLNPRLQEIFNMVGFDKVFPIYPDLQTAQNSAQAS